jgi:hypothetical protein
MKTCSHFTMLQTLWSISAASAVLSAAGAPDPPETMDQTQGDMDWRFWVVLVSLIAMTGSQLTQDVLELSAWNFPATSVAPQAVPDVAMLDVPAVSNTLLSSTADEHSMSEPVVLDAGASSAAAMTPPSVPIFVSRHGDK